MTRGKVGFLSGVLKSAGVSIDGIQLVQQLLSSNPSDRPTASAIRQHCWLDESRLYNNHWFVELKREFAQLGVVLDLGPKKPELIRQLLERDIVSFIPATAKEEVSALLYQALTKNLSLVTSALLESRNRAIPNAIEEAFHRVVGAGNIPSANVLLARANKAVVDSLKNGRIPLQIVAGRGELDMVKLLLQNEADVNGGPEGCDGGTALQAAAGEGHMDVVRRLLLEGAEIYASQPSRSAIHVSVETGQISILSLLVQTHQVRQGPGQATQLDWDAFKMAVATGRIDIVKLLLSTEARLALGKGAVMALQAAVEHGQLPTAKLFLDLGVDPNGCPDGVGSQTTLEIVASNGHTDIVILLLSVGAPINATVAKRGNSRTALSSASYNGHSAIVEFLLSGGARVNSPQLSDFGRTALEAAAEGGYIDLVKLLLRKGAFLNSPCRVGGCGTAVRRVKQEKEQISPRLVEGSGTALHAAAEGGHVDVVRLLLHARANINKRLAYGRKETALTFASQAGHMDVVGLLLSEGAQVHSYG